jgi:hypothetical protein
MFICQFLLYRRRRLLSGKNELLHFEDYSKSKEIDEEYKLIIPELDGLKKLSTNCRIHDGRLLKAGSIRSVSLHPNCRFIINLGYRRFWLIRWRIKFLLEDLCISRQ